MDKKDLFTAGIFYTAFLAFLLTGIGFIISPLKSDIKQNRAAIQNLNVKLDTKIQSLNVKLDANIQALNAKLDRLIFAVLKNNPAPGGHPRRKPSAYKNTQTKTNQ